MVELNRRRFLGVAALSVAAAFGAGGQPVAAVSPRRIPSAIDVSWLPDVQATRTPFFTAGRKQIDPYKLMAVSGVEYGRIRVWVAPTTGHSSLARAIKIAKQLKKNRMKVLLDFHLSDTWADPGWQAIPAGWSTTDIDVLESQVNEYLTNSLLELKRKGIVPEIVQVGNEIGNGFLWPMAPINSSDAQQWQNFIQLYNSAVATVREVSPKSKIMLHLHNGGDAGWLSWWWGKATEFGITQNDFIGVSFYSVWHGDLEDLEAGLRFLTENAGQKVWVVETAYPWTSLRYGNDVLDTSRAELNGYPLTPAGQAAYVRELQRILRSMPNNRGLGIGWWEGLAINAYGNARIFVPGMQNSTLVNNKAVALAALRILGKG